jgi:hypothetical protein
LQICGVDAKFFTETLAIHLKWVISKKVLESTEEEELIMRIEEIKEIAKQHNIKTGKVKKSDLVKSIQQAEGNEQCFDSGKATLCGQPACAWREDCN